MRSCEICFAIDGVKLFKIRDQIVCEKCEIFLVDEVYDDDEEIEEGEYYCEEDEDYDELVG